MAADHKVGFRIMALVAHLGIIIMVITSQDLIEVCQVMKEVEANLIKVQM